ncbi:MAG: hypothetical protein ABIR96_08010 [Bdellovibrionota bacterium]
MFPVLLLALQACSNPFAFSKNPGCFETHVQDAMKLYEVRKEQYSALSQGRTTLAINVLMLLQRLNLPKAKAFDRRALALNKKGLEGLGCQEFVSMDGVPPFQARIVPSSPEKFTEMNLSALTKNLSLLLEEKNYLALTQTADEGIAALNSATHHNCLVRHFLESIARAADLTPRHLREAAKLGLEDEARAWSEDFIGLNISVLRTANFLDQRVSGFQDEGFAVFCQDLPRIPKY